MVPSEGAGQHSHPESCLTCGGSGEPVRTSVPTQEALGPRGEIVVVQELPSVAASLPHGEPARTLTQRLGRQGLLKPGVFSCSVWGAGQAAAGTWEELWC